MGFSHCRQLRLPIYYITCLSIICFLGLPLTVFPCWGSRPLAMGGAFTGVADDANAVYWNPAGLVQLTQPSLTSMFATDPDKLNYDQYIGFGMPLTIDLSTISLTPSVGFAYTYNQDPDYTGYISDLGGGLYEIINFVDSYNDFLHLSGGMFIYPDVLAVGLNLKTMMRGFTLEGWQYNANSNTWVSLGSASYEDHAYDIDVGILMLLGPKVRKSPQLRMFSVGCLVQNSLRSKYKDLGIKHIRNYRPGLGFRPSQDILLTIEVYDAAKEYFDKPQMRYGGEVWCLSHPKTRKKILALRGGVYHENEKEMKAYTYGLGIRFPLDIIQTDKAENIVEFDYALMHWIEAKENTHLISLGIRF